MTRDEIVLDLFNKNMSMYGIAKQLKVDTSVIRNIYKRLNLKSIHKSKKREDPIINHTNEIITRYINGESSYKIAKDFNCQDSTIVRFLQKNGISLRENRKLNYDFDYFKKIDREDRAYTIGLLYADGTNSGNYIRLSMIDKDIIEKVKAVMGFDGIIKEIQPRGKSKFVQYSLLICGKQICDDLSKLGCVPNKTFSLRIPEGILSDDLFRHFLRGLIDGDGTITRTKEKRNWIVRVVGSKELMKQIGDKTRELLGINYSYFPAKQCESGQIYYCAWGGRKKLTKLLDWIYKDSTIHMNRKYAKYLEFLESSVLL